MKARNNLAASLFIILATSACQERIEDRFIIKGVLSRDISILEGKKMYLVDMNRKDVLMDSATVKDGRFYFEHIVAVGFTPIRAMLKYPDTTRDPNILRLYNASGFLAFLRPVGFINPYKAKTIESVFYIEKGITVFELSGKSQLVRLNGGFICNISGSTRQTLAQFRHLEIPMPNIDSIQRQPAIKAAIELIMSYPYSVALLQNFFYNKDHYAVNELRSLASLFNQDVQQMSLFKNLQAYIVYRENGASVSPIDLRLTDSASRRIPVINKQVRYNLLVFWASWCGPCRKEIPLLKKFYNDYEPKGLAMQSVSIDNDSIQWIKSLKLEKMPWKQFIVREIDKADIENRFNVHEIPTMFLIDADRNKVIEKWNVLDSNAIRKIDHYLGVVSNN